MFEAELKEYVSKSLKIYTDANKNDRISYISLTDSHKIYEASRSIREQRSGTRYKETNASVSSLVPQQIGIITAKRPETAKHAIAEFEIERVDLKYDVQVKNRTDNGRLQVTVTNVNDRKDTDYLDLANRNMTREELTEWL